MDLGLNSSSNISLNLVIFEISWHLNPISRILLPVAPLDINLYPCLFKLVQR